MILPKALSHGTVVLIFLLLFLPWCLFDDHGEASDARNAVVGVVFFSSKNCPLCEPVKELLKGLRVTYPIRVKTFDIEREADYLLFERLESIHGRGKFSVPLIMLGDTILMGENEIAEHLEKTVQNLAVSGGSPLPYLGPGKGAGRSAKRAKHRHNGKKRVIRADPDAGKKMEPQSAEPKDKGCPTCDKKGRPPSLGEEWSKIKGLIDKYF